MSTFVFRLDIYESRDFPIVRHEFRGKTRAEAHRHYLAHMGTDRFMQECIDTGRYGAIVCNVDVKEFIEP